MLLPIDRDTRTWLKDPALNNPLDQIGVKRGDTPSLVVSFVSAGVVQEMANALACVLIGKVAGDYDGKAVIYADTFTKTGTGATTTYTFKPGFNVVKLNNLLGFDTNTYTVNGTDIVGFAQETDLYCVADLASSLQNKVISSITDAQGLTTLWCNVGGAGVQPTIGGTTRYLAVPFAANASAATIATATATALAADAYLFASATGSRVDITDLAAGSRTAATAGTAGCRVETWIIGAAPHSMSRLKNVTLDFELEWTIGAEVCSSNTIDLVVTFDERQGNEGNALNANPAYLIAPWEIKTADLTAVAGHRYQIDTTGGAITVTLPATAAVSDEIAIEDAALGWSANNVTLARNGLKINSGTSDYTANVIGGKLSLVYISTGYGWSVK